MRRHKNGGFIVEGLGWAKKDRSGFWYSEHREGRKRLSPEWQAALNHVDRYEKEFAVRQAELKKPSPLAPRLWDGPMPGDKCHSFLWRGEVAAESSLDYDLEVSVGSTLMIKSLGWVISLGLSSAFYDIDCKILHNGNVFKNIGRPGFGSSGQFPLLLMVPGGKITFRTIINESGADCKVVLAAGCWERIPPLLGD